MVIINHFTKLSEPDGRPAKVTRDLPTAQLCLAGEVLLFPSPFLLSHRRFRVSLPFWRISALVHPSERSCIQYLPRLRTFSPSLPSLDRYHSRTHGWLLVVLLLVQRTGKSTTVLRFAIGGSGTCGRFFRTRSFPCTHRGAS